MNITLLSQLRVFLGKVYLPNACLSRVSALGFAVMMFTISAKAGELPYSSTPLFWATGVQPNVALLVDNSGSMTDTDTGGTGNVISPCNGSTVAQPMTRMEAAKHAACQVVQDNSTSMRMSLFAFTGGGATDSTSTGTQLQGFGTSAGPLKTSVQGLSANQNTPLSGAMLTMLNSYRGGVSPIQYRCQKNYIVFFTDGEPSSGIDYDVGQNGATGTTCATDANSCNTFVLPTLTPVQSSPWTGSTAQSGAAMGSTATNSWDSFPDPIYSGGGGRRVYPFLDDLAQFGYDVDIKGSTSAAVPAATCPSGGVSALGKDCAGKDWNGADDTDTSFAKQNVVTYTVGLGAEANNGLLRNTPLVNRITLTPANVNTVSNEITLTGHGLEEGQFVHYYRTLAPGSFSITAAADVSSETLTGDTSNMQNGDLLSYNNAGGATLRYVVTPASSATSCSDAGATMGLTSGNTYYVAWTGATTLRLATSTANAATCAAAANGAAAVGANCIDLTTTGAIGTTQTLTRPALAPAAVTFNLVAPYSTVNLQTAANTITSGANHNFYTGDAVTYTCATTGGSACGSTGTRVIAGLTGGSTYYVAVISPTVFKLASSAANAASCLSTALNCIDLGNPTNGGTTVSDIRVHTFTRAAAGIVTASLVADGTVPTPVDNGTNIEELTFGANHNLKTGNAITYTCSGGAPAVALVLGNQATYYAQNVSSNNPGTFQLSLTSGGTPVDIYASGNSSQTFAWTRTYLAGIGGLYGYETDARPDASPDPLTELSARGKYYVKYLTENTFKLHECGPVLDCTAAAAAAVDITSKGYGFLSTGPGKSYFSDTAAQLSVALATAFKSISANTLSFSAVATTSEEAGTTKLYQAKFATSDWSGEVVALGINPVTGDVVYTPPDWLASDHVPAYPGRTILTWDLVNSTGAVVNNVASLNPIPAISMNATLTATEQQKVLDWVLGKDDATWAGSRIREHGVYGDILSGSPHYVGSPNGDYDTKLPTSDPGKSSYAAYKIAQAGRTPMLYVGANDGMLHAIDANTGVERMGFIPYGVYVDFNDTNDNGIRDTGEPYIQKFYELSREGYGQIPLYPHRYFVDGEAISGDAFFTIAKAGLPANSWHTVLVGGLGRGGRSVYALDVTEPSVFNPGKVLWEWSTYANGRMGYSFSKPIIARLQTGQWAAIFGNGYDAANDLGSLFIINLETGSLIKRMDASGSKGLSSVSVLKDTTGTVTAVYGGDLAGNVWKFDISDPNSGLWLTAVNTPLFVAKDSNGNPQPITSPIALGSKPPSATCTGGQVCSMLYFGTGTYFQNSDKSYTFATANPKHDSFYALYDSGAGSIPADKSTLVEQTLGTTTINSVTYRTSSANPLDYSIRNGWYMKLLVGANYEGERVVFEPVLVDGVVFFTTVIPASADPCISGGTSWLMGLTALDGSMRPVLFDTNGDGEFDSTDGGTAGKESTSGLFTRPVVRLTTKVINNPDGTETTQLIAELYVGTSGGGDLNSDPAIYHDRALLGEKKRTPPGAYPAGRMSWRQLQ